MSSLIEQAAERLQQLNRAGVVLDPLLDGNAVSGAFEAVVTSSYPAQPLAPPAPSGPPVVSRCIELDLEAISALGIVTPNAARSRIADQYRVIKRPLIANAIGKTAAGIKHGNLIMVTSALAGEGKSFTAVNLAMSIATELDHTVLLVDADVARPSVPRMLGFEPGPGLLDVLKSSAEMSNVMLRTNIDKLSILASGTPHHRATELLASDAMRQLLDEIATRYADRIIIFDSPPLLLTTEARVLASHMGQVVMVVQANRTLQSDVLQALSTIENCPIRMMLLNQARLDAESGGYGYGYGQGYGYGYGYGSDVKHEGPKVQAA
jgi:protein-tyrosine kinase